MWDKNTTLNVKRTINARGRLIDLSTPKVMGILNITPDSFYSGSRINSIDAALQTVEKMLEDGAAFIDMGSYSSRPGAEDISEEEEIKRLLPVLKAVASEFPDAVLSIDTFRAPVAEVAIKEGAHIINDISGGNLDAGMFETVGRLQVPYILMHMKGTPQTMKQLCQYDNMLLEILQYFSRKINKLKSCGVKDIILDPGFGFAKTIEQNFELLKNFDSLTIAGLPVLAGVSRKSMIWKTLDIKADDALNGTTVLNTMALLNGANILRVHDVKEAVEAVKLVAKL